MKKPMLQRPRRAERTVMPGLGPGLGPDREPDWMEDANMPEGLGGIDPDYDRAEDVPQVLRGSWRMPKFEGE